MKAWKKYVVILVSIMVGGILCSGGQEEWLAWGQSGSEEAPEGNLLTIFQGSESGEEVADEEETAPDPGPGAFTVGSPTGDANTPYDFQPMKLKINIPSDDAPECESEGPYPVQLELTGDNNNVTILDEEGENTIDIDNHTFEKTTLVQVKATQPSEHLGDIEITATCPKCGEIGKDVVNATAVVVDLDIDSDNDETFSVNFDRDNDDIEDDATKPGKFLAVNDGDADNDGIPDFADFETSVVYQGNTPVRFTPLVLELPEPLELEKVRIRLTYSASDPNGVTGSGTQADPYAAAPGHLRIWKVDGSVNRNMSEVSPGGEGHYVKPDSEYEPFALGPGREIRLFVEGIRESSSIAEQQIKVEIDPNGDDEEPGFIGEDTVRVTVIRVDLDIDSDNNNGFDVPSGTAYDEEDHIEDIQDDANRPGKMIAANLGNVDKNVDTLYNEVPNFADGLNKYNNEGPNAGGNFTPIVLELPEPLELKKIKIRFTSSASDPNDITRTGQGTIHEPYRYSPAPEGHFRIWKVDGAVNRNIAEVRMGGEGHYVKPDSEYKASDLGPGRIIPLYIEGINASSGIADQQIKIEIDPNGDEGEPGFICKDAVRVTIIKPDIISPPNRSDYNVSEENYTTTPPIPFRARIVPIELNWQGNIDWTLNLDYDTTKQRGPWPRQRGFQTANGATHEERYTSEGGRIMVNARVTDFAGIEGLSPENMIMITITGVPIPDDVITARLITLYNGATPNLLTGIAAVESGTNCYCQFYNMTKYGVTDRWPRESEEDGGSHIGLMQVPVTMEDAWNWLTNTQTAVTNHLNPAFSYSDTYENRQREKYPDLRALTDVERENNALSLYRIWRVYYVPNANGTDWIVHPANHEGVGYVDDVRQNLR